MDIDTSLAITEPAVRKRQRRGELNHLNMYWSLYGGVNFGDWIGPYLFQKLRGIPPAHCRTRRVSPPGALYFTAGSILNMIKKDDVAVVWGSGTMVPYPTFSRPKKTYALRGPYSQAAMDNLGYEVPDCLGDPGICLPLFYRPPCAKTHRIGIVPHLVDMDYWRAQDLPEDVRLIGLNRTIEPVVDDILSCETILSSSLHGIITAHSYGIPCAWARPAVGTLSGDDTKFLDYFASVGLPWGPQDALALAHASDLPAAAAHAGLAPADMAALAQRLLDVCPFAEKRVPA